MPKDSPLYLAVKLLLNLAFRYFVANAIMFYLAFCLVFAIIMIINFNSGEVGFVFTPQFAMVGRLLGVSLEKGKVSDFSFLLPAFYRLSFVVMILEYAFNWIRKSLFKKTWEIKHMGLYFGIGLSTLLFAGALWSCFYEKAASGAKEVAPIIFIFYIAALVSLFVYKGIRSGTNWVLSRLESRNIKEILVK